MALMPASGASGAVPSVAGKPLFVPSARVTVAVGLVLLLFASLVAATAGLVHVGGPPRLLTWSSFALALGCSGVPSESSGTSASSSGYAGVGSPSSTRCCIRRCACCSLLALRLWRSTMASNPFKRQQSGNANGSCQSQGSGRARCVDGSFMAGLVRSMSGDGRRPPMSPSAAVPNGTVRAPDRPQAVRRSCLTPTFAGARPDRQRRTSSAVVGSCVTAAAADL